MKLQKMMLRACSKEWGEIVDNVRVESTLNTKGREYSGVWVWTAQGKLMRNATVLHTNRKTHAAIVEIAMTAMRRQAGGE